jgi:hypothetical protein
MAYRIYILRQILQTFISVVITIRISKIFTYYVHNL